MIPWDPVSCSPVVFENVADLAGRLQHDGKCARRISRFRRRGASNIAQARFEEITEPVAKAVADCGDERVLHTQVSAGARSDVTRLHRQHQLRFRVVGML